MQRFQILVIGFFHQATLCVLSVGLKKHLNVGGALVDDLLLFFAQVFMSSFLSLKRLVVVVVSKTYAQNSHVDLPSLIYCVPLKLSPIFSNKTNENLLDGKCKQSFTF